MQSRPDKPWPTYGCGPRTSGWRLPAVEVEAAPGRPWPVWLSSTGCRLPMRWGTSASGTSRERWRRPGSAGSWPASSDDSCPVGGSVCGCKSVLVSDLDRWNHNLHYHPMILNAVPAGCERALDVGCGEGTLTRQLRQSVPHVTGIDIDAASVELAQAHPDATDIDYVQGDFLTDAFEPASFDLVASVACLHHMDAMTLARMRDLVSPGGVLAVIGLARSQHPVDLPREVAAVVAHRLHRLTKHYWQHPSPTVWPPPETYASMRTLAERVLPGVRYRRHLLWRYSLVWVNPQ